MTTKKSQKIEINSSSIVDLKAELFRKQEEVRLKRNLNGSEKLATNEEKFLDEINDDHLYDKNAHKISRLTKKILGDDESKPAKNDKSAKSLSKLDEAVKLEEEMAFAKSRTMLEKKAKLYEQMALGSVIPDADNEELLVNFDQKSSLHYNKKASTSRHSEKTKNDEELVEYQDEFGRTRYVKRKDLPEKIEKKGEKEPDLYQPSSSWSRNSDLLSDDMKREIERREWEEETYQEMEEPSLAKRKVHYEDIREGEIRDHGVAFFNFSVDEQARAEQLEMLKQMREETENKQSEKQRIKEKRKQMLKARLAKVAARKGIALPDESSEESDNEPAEKATYIEKAKLKVDSDPVKK
ncbi:PREDICTED: coiled-coil domain-containing protein 174-like [Rhagoletis zephyria]|uniref:coiled-coil domain-containing protein 174-like n=1 Tax=Rhagoletis zephyria TaxID=28612 RepID=UPI0008118C5A|nr:PREDICTED: coiled-coil domain-containing protein 174-like [Rhagoletis zephyria]